MSQNLKQLSRLLAIIIPLAILWSAPLLFARSGPKSDSLLALLPETPSRKGKINLLNEIAHELRKSHPDSAIFYAGQALQLSMEEGDSLGMADAYFETGMVHRYRFYLDEARDWLVKAYGIYIRNGYDEKIGETANQIGITHGIQGDYDRAGEYFRAGLKANVRTGNKAKQAECHNNLGNVYKYKGDYTMSVEHYNHSLNIYRELGDSAGIANSYHNIGNIHSKLGRYGEALEYHETALGIREEINHRHGIAMSLISTASVYRHLGDYQKSNRLALRAFEMSEELGSPMFRQGSSKVLADNYSDLGQYREALEYQKIYQKMSDSLMNEANIKKITRLEMQYGFDKQQKEKEFQRQQEMLEYEAEVKKQKILTWTFITGFILVIIMAFLILRGYYQKRRANRLLAEQKEEIQAMNEQLQDSLGEKEVLLKEIHHRVKNNLQIISSLLSLQSRDITDEAVQDAVKEGQSRVKSMALIHQMLYQSEQISRIRFGEYLEQLASSLASMYQSESDITCKISADGIDLDVDTAIPLGLIINELVSNSFKYAFAGRASGRITVDLKSEGEAFRLTVSDDGIGMPEEIGPEKSSSLGLRLVNILTRQLNGRLKRRDGQGTTFIINFGKPIIANEPDQDTDR